MILPMFLFSPSALTITRACRSRHRNLGGTSSLMVFSPRNSRGEEEGASIHYRIDIEMYVACLPLILVQDSGLASPLLPRMPPPTRLCVDEENTTPIGNDSAARWCGCKFKSLRGGGLEPYTVDLVKRG